MDRKIRVLFLPKWYPNRYDPMPGLFIQRQAEAITPWCDVAVIYVHPDPDCTRKHEVEFSVENQVRVLRVYYKITRSNGSLIGKAYNMWRFYRAFLKAFHSIREFSPELVHAHILTRIGLIGWKIAGNQHIPLVISEHWSRYYPENNTYRGWLRKLATVFVVRRADAVVTVSVPLREAMERCGLVTRAWRVIPNVVDPEPTPAETHAGAAEEKTFVHISCFEDRSKNISGFLRSVKELYSRRKDFVCLMVGTGPDWEDMKEYAEFLGLPGSLVKFTGLRTGTEFSEILGSADFSVLSSRYETFGTVVPESLARGLPVVATRVGIAAEVISDENGLLVIPGDEAAMTLALNRMLDNCRNYNKELIRKSIQGKFKREAVGEQLVSVYREVIGKSNARRSRRKT